MLLKLRTKLILYLLLILVIVAATLAGCLLIYHFVLKSLLFQASRQIFQLETAAQLDHNWLEQVGIEKLIGQIFRNLESVNFYHNLIPNLQDFNITPSIECLVRQNLIDNYTFATTQCYGIFNKSASINDRLQLKTTLQVNSLLTEYRHTFALIEGNQLYYTIFTPAAFYSISKGINFPPNYSPAKRSWYLDFMAAGDKSRVFGKPYKVLVGNIKVPLMMPLKSPEYEGVLVQELAFERIMELFERSDVVGYIVNLQGFVIYCAEYLNLGTDMFYIFNQPRTGFNEQDWLQIRGYILNQQYENNCGQMTKLNFLCRKNTKENTTLLIEVKQISQSPYYLILYKKDQIYFKQEQEAVFFINKQMADLYEEIFLQFLLALLLVVIIAYITLGLVMQQTNLIILYAQSRTKKLSFEAVQLEIKQRLDRLLVKSDTISKLLESMDTMYFQKGKQCGVSQSKPCIELHFQEYPRYLFVGYVKKLLNYLDKSLKRINLMSRLVLDPAGERKIRLHLVRSALNNIKPLYEGQDF